VQVYRRAHLAAHHPLSLRCARARRSPRRPAPHSGDADVAEARRERVGVGEVV